MCGQRRGRAEGGRQSLPLRVRRSYRGANPWARAQGRALAGGPGRRGALGRDELRRDSRQAFLGQVIFRNVMAREDSESEEERDRRDSGTWGEK